MSAADIARAFHRHRCGAVGYICHCPLPTHGKGRGDLHPSLSVKDGDSAPLLYCFAGCDARDIFDELRRRVLRDDGRDPRRHRGGRRVERVVAIPEPEPDTEALEQWRARAADQRHAW